MARPTGPVAYDPDLIPILADPDQKFIQAQLARIALSIASLCSLSPQPAAVAPKAPQDGMVRLSRSPWRPLSGQTADQWVYFDGPSGTWKSWTPPS